jgi:hypothetical protein
LVLSVPPKLAQRLGALPPNFESAKRALAKRGVAAEKLRSLSSISDSNWDCARCLGTWLDGHKDCRVTFLCGRFEGRKWRYLLDALVSPADVERVHLRPVRNPEYDETNWWKCKDGQLDFFNGAVGYAHALLIGEGEVAPPWDPDQYEKTLQSAATTTPR